ncbi:hypothetical protein B1R32_108132 [Abditibacterium utsteinense]|uniref:Uncharacterized protein n=1 Tax=Abditibacterium utsteinense TaxID=1960156 RepID=A0A2S8SSZ4_9BACT|nr:hypothetical protein [Abditibacterium utsteinense]PQV63921.1 hypothetical protein B1R32_108132 [Abditibacterium utsteinense]
MSDHSAAKPLLDDSFFESILVPRELEGAPPDLESDIAPLENFDWENYNRAFFESLPESAKSAPQTREIAEIAGGGLWMARQFSPEVVAFLLHETAPLRLWNYLSGKSRKELLSSATHGFQRKPQIVKQPMVRSRIAQWLHKNPAHNFVLLMLWSLETPPVIARAASLSDDSDWQIQLPILVKEFGAEAILCALASAAKPRAFLALREMLKDAENFARLIEQASVEITSETEDSTKNEAEFDLSDATTGNSTKNEANFSEDETGSESARVWKEKWQRSETSRTEVCEMLEQVLDAQEKSLAQLSAQSAKLGEFEKREKTSAALLEKRFGAIQKRLQLELDELKKTYERQNRKFRALERDKAELDIENRRFKKQLRHAGILLEEERKKVAALDGKTQTAGATVEALSTPNSRQSAPDKPVVVQAPTLLDEIFEWRADKRLVRITPRAVRRLIDGNNEEGVFAVVQALESLEFSDRSLHGKFFKRIGEGGGYYVRVLKENMARVLVDASNVARHTPNKYGKGQLRFLLGMREELRRLGCFPIVFIADASLRHVIDESRKFHEMVANGEIEVVDKGVEADEILAREARRTGAYVVTNDAKFFHKVSPDFEPPRVTFRIFDGTVIVDDF